MAFNAIKSIQHLISLSNRIFKRLKILVLIPVEEFFILNPKSLYEDCFPVDKQVLAT